MRAAESVYASPAKARRGIAAATETHPDWLAFLSRFYAELRNYAAHDEAPPLPIDIDPLPRRAPRSRSRAQTAGERRGALHVLNAQERRTRQRADAARMDAARGRRIPPRSPAAL